MNGLHYLAEADLAPMVGLAVPTTPLLLSISERNKVKMFKKISLCILMSSWILLLIVELTLVQRLVFSTILVLTYYWGFYLKPEYKYVLISATIVLYVAVILVVFRNIPIVIELYKQNWPSFIFLPLITVSFLSLRTDNPIKELVFVLLVILLLRHSVDAYSIILSFVDGSYNWVFFSMVLFEVLFFVFIPLDFNNSSQHCEKIVFTYERKVFFRSLSYLLLLIAVHQLYSFIFNGTVYNFSKMTFRSHYVSFIASTTIAALPEEILYRGFLYHLLIKKFSSIKKATIIVAVIFGFAHYQFGIMFVIYAMFTSLVFTKVYQKTGSMVYPVLIHGLLNVYL